MRLHVENNSGTMGAPLRTMDININYISLEKVPSKQSVTCAGLVTLIFLLLQFRQPLLDLTCARRGCCSGVSMTMAIQGVFG